MIYKYKFPLGDWSGDGHNDCVWFDVQGSKPIEDVREAHFKCPEVFGFDIGDMCGKYEEIELNSDIIKKLNANGISPSIKEWGIETDDLFTIWLDILNYIDPELKLKPCDEFVETISFFGYDKKERHLSVPGYGLLGN